MHDGLVELPQCVAADTPLLSLLLVAVWLAIQLDEVVMHCAAVDTDAE